LLEHPIGCFTDVVSLIEQSPRVINW